MEGPRCPGSRRIRKLTQLRKRFHLLWPDKRFFIRVLWDDKEVPSATSIVTAKVDGKWRRTLECRPIRTDEDVNLQCFQEDIVATCTATFSLETGVPILCKPNVGWRSPDHLPLMFPSSGTNTSTHTGRRKTRRRRGENAREAVTTSMVKLCGKWERTTTWPKMTGKIWLSWLSLTQDRIRLINSLSFLGCLARSGKIIEERLDKQKDHRDV